MVVSTSDCHPRGPWFDARLYLRNFSWKYRIWNGVTQPREDNWGATWMRTSEIRLRKLKLTTRPPSTATWQQPLQSVLALWGYMYYMSCSSQSSRFKIPNYVRRSTVLCNFIHSPVILYLSAPNIFLSILFSNTLNLCSFVRWTKFHNHTIQPVI